MKLTQGRNESSLLYEFDDPTDSQSEVIIQ
jgi:hypothetical protein